MGPVPNNVLILFGLCLYAALVDVVHGGACFQFTGDNYASFSPENLDISSKAHFRLMFNTTKDAGLIYYAEGTYQQQRVYDYEGVFLRGGYLHYFLFNPAEYSIGSSFGFYGRSKKKLNDGEWHTVEFYRNIEMTIVDPFGGREQVEQTGLKVDGEAQAVDNRLRTGVNIFKPIILGGDPHADDRPTGSPIPGFEGEIKDFVDIIHNYAFDEFNSTKKQVIHCMSSSPDPA